MSISQNELKSQLLNWKEMAADVYGDGWQSRMSRHLGHAPQTVGKWVHGKHRVPPSVLKLLECYVLLGWRYDPDTNQVGEEA